MVVFVRRTIHRRSREDPASVPRPLPVARYGFVSLSAVARDFADVASRPDTPANTR